MRVLVREVYKIKTLLLVSRFFLRFRFGDRKEILRDRKYFI